MPVFPCANKSLCLDPSSPFQNLSAELPDQPVFIGRSTGFGPMFPPLGSDFFAVGCTTFCISDISQEDADECAARGNVDCLSEQWPVTVPTVDVFGNPVASYRPRPVFRNSPQTATVTCPDGNPFTFTVAAGRFEAFNQAQADAIAASYAQAGAKATQVCIGALSPAVTCMDAPYAGSVTASGAFLTPATTCWTIFGQLPPGISSDIEDQNTCQTGSNTLNFFGTPTVPGIYSFQIQVEDSRGDFMVKTVTLRVVAITTTSLPDGAPFQPYSEQVTQVGVTNPIFTLESGELPLGLALDAQSGVIFGTPIQAETKQFVLSVTEAGTGITCFGPELSIKIGGDLNFSLLNWDAPTVVNNGGIATGTWSQNAFSINNQPSVASPFNIVANSAFAVPMSYTGPLVNCNLHLVITQLSTGAGNFPGPITISQDGGNVLNIDLGDGSWAVGTFDVPFVIAAGTNSQITCDNASCQISFNNVLEVTGTITPAV